MYMIGLHCGNDINPYSTHNRSIFVKFCKSGKFIDDPFKSVILLKIKIFRLHKTMKLNIAVVS